MTAGTARWHGALLAALLVAGCSAGEGSPPGTDASPTAAAPAAGDVEDQLALLDPCGGADHPCTLEGVDPQVAARSERLVAEAAERLGADGSDLETAAGWLAEQPEVVSVATGDATLRFRIRGDRAQWLFTRSRGDRASPMVDAPSSAPPPRSTKAPDPAVLAMPTPPQAQAQVQAQPDTAEDQGKRALVLSPFSWQWELEGADSGLDPLLDALASTRDYQPANGGRIDVYEDRLGTTADGLVTIAEEITLDVMSSWRSYDYVYLLTHGGFVCEIGKGAQSQPAGAGACTTALMTSWSRAAVTQDILGELESDSPEGDARAQELADRLGKSGIETGWIAVDAAAGQRYPAVEATGLTFKRADQASAEAFNDGGTELPSGKIIGGPLVVLTSEFFRDTYSGGLTDSLVFLNACSSGQQSDLLQALSGPGTGVIGWNKPMYLDAATAAATTITTELLTGNDRDRPSGGLRMKAALDTVDGDVRDAVRASLSGGAPSPLLGIVGDRMADPTTGATLDRHGNEDVRIREIVRLVDDDGAELGPVPVEIDGTPGDGEDDDLVLNIRVDGIDADTDPAAIGLSVEVDGERHDLPERLDREIRPGEWEVTVEVPLGRDHDQGETVDLEVIARLPEGADSQWRYEDVPLSRGCTLSFTYDGHGVRPGDYEGPITGEASHDTTEDTGPYGGGGMQLINIDRSGQRVPAVHVIMLSDHDPVFAQLALSSGPEGVGIPLGETGTFRFYGGGFLHGDELNRFEVGGTIEVTVTASEWTTFGEDDEPIPTVFVGTFRNVGALTFDNPFPENGTAAEVTDLAGSFSFDASVCPSNIL